LVSFANPDILLGMDGPSTSAQGRTPEPRNEAQDHEKAGHRDVSPRNLTLLGDSPSLGLALSPLLLAEFRLRESWLRRLAAKVLGEDEIQAGDVGLQEVPELLCFVRALGLAFRRAIPAALLKFEGFCPEAVTQWGQERALAHYELASNLILHDYAGFSGGEKENYVLDPSVRRSLETRQKNSSEIRIVLSRGSLEIHVSGARPLPDQYRQEFSVIRKAVAGGQRIDELQIPRAFGGTVHIAEYYDLKVEKKDPGSFRYQTVLPEILPRT
jgi:hypothetical protein